MLRTDIIQVNPTGKCETPKGLDKLVSTLKAQSVNINNKTLSITVREESLFPALALIETGLIFLGWLFKSFAFITGVMKKHDLDYPTFLEAAAKYESIKSLELLDFIERYNEYGEDEFKKLVVKFMKVSNNITGVHTNMYREVSDRLIIANNKIAFLERAGGEGGEGIVPTEVEVGAEIEPEAPAPFSYTGCFVEYLKCKIACEFILFILSVVSIVVGVIYALYQAVVLYFFTIKSIAPESNKMYYGIHAFVFTLWCLFMKSISDKFLSFCAQIINGAGESTGNHFNNIRHYLCGGSCCKKKQRIE